MRAWAMTMGGVLLLAALGTAQTLEEKKLAQYLTREGKLTYPIDLVEEWKNLIATRLDGGGKPFTSFAGTTIKVGVDGRWKVQNIWQNKVITKDYAPDALQLRRVSASALAFTPTPETTGQLSAEQMKELAKELVRHDLLEVQGGGLDPRSNHHFLTVRFGSKEGTVVLGVDQRPETLPFGQAARTDAQRVQGVALALRKIIDQSKKTPGAATDANPFFTPPKK